MKKHLMFLLERHPLATFSHVAQKSLIIILLRTVADKMAA